VPPLPAEADVLLVVPPLLDATNDSPHPASAIAEITNRLVRSTALMDLPPCQSRKDDGSS
jgi:hypothetical protein